MTSKAPPSGVFLALLVCLLCLTRSGCERLGVGYARALLTVHNKGTAHTTSTVGLKLYCTVASGRNVVLSPVSVTAGLSMLYLGARGATADELERTIGLSGKPLDENLHMSIGQLSAPPSNQDFTFKTANNLFVNPQQPLMSHYTSLAKRAYRVTPTLMDFAQNPEGNRVTINDWVASKTEGKITELLPAGAISEVTQLILVNAVFFSAKWASAFSKSKTSLQDFKREDGQTMKVQMMSREGSFNFAVSKPSGVQILEIPYAARPFSMFLLLPSRQSSLSAFEAQLCSMDESLAQYISSVKSKMTSKTVEVSMPKFTVQEDLSLHELLPALGVTSLFQENVADLSGIDGTRNLYVAQAQHKAFVKVDESGTTAAAATASGVVFRSLPPQFIADRPFMFVIYDKRHKAVLFLGRVHNPVA